MRAIKLAASLVLCTGVTSERPNMESVAVASFVCAAAAPIIRLSISDIARWRSSARSVGLPKMGIKVVSEIDYTHQAARVWEELILPSMAQLFPHLAHLGLVRRP